MAVPIQRSDDYKNGSHAENISTCDSETQNHNGRLTRSFLGSGARLILAIERRTENAAR